MIKPDGNGHQLRALIDEHQDYEQAIRFIQSQDEADLTAEELYLYGFCLLQTGCNLPLAIHYLDRAEKRGFSKYWVWMHRAPAHLRAGNIPGALTDALSAVSIDATPAAERLLDHVIEVAIAEVNGRDPICGMLLKTMIANQKRRDQSRSPVAQPSPSTVVSQPADDATLCARSVVDPGNTARLQRVLAKARGGGAVTVGLIGGSITHGGAASSPERRYATLVAAWWRQQFPRSQIRFVNAGTGATGSNYGALRAQRDLLGQKPDFVVVEYAVNDVNTRACAETMEGLVRQVLRTPAQPAVCLLFWMHQNGTNAQDWHSKVGRHYGLPMISVRDALWPEIQAGHLKWEDVEADHVHPNDRGHAYAAQFITAFLADTLRSLSKESRPAPTAMELPTPLISNLFERVHLLEADALKPVRNQGWTYDSHNHCWKADKPGSVAEFDVRGAAVLTMHSVLSGPMGQARVSVDAGPPKELEGWFDGTWGGYRQTTEITRGLLGGKHRVRIEVLANKHPQSAGTEFRILGLGTAES